MWDFEELKLQERLLWDAEGDWELEQGKSGEHQTRLKTVAEQTREEPPFAISFFLILAIKSDTNKVLGTGDAIGELQCIFLL